MCIILFVSLYTSRVVLSTLGVVDYGIYNVVGGLVAIFTYLTSALGSASSRFITFNLGKGDLIELTKTFRTSLTIHLCFALLVLVIGETIGLLCVSHFLNIPSDRMIAANYVYQYVLILCVCSILQVPFSAEIIAHEKMSYYAYLGIFEAVAKLAVAYLITTNTYDRLSLYGFLLCCVGIFVFMGYFLYCMKLFRYLELRLLFDPNLFKSMLSYSGWNFIGSLAYLGKSQGVNILLNIFFGPIINAARGIAYQIDGAILNFTQNFTIALNPQIIKSYASGEKERFYSLIILGGKVSCLLILIFAVPIIIESNYVLILWLEEVPDNTSIFVQLIVLTSLVDSYSYSLSASIQATGRIKLYQILVGIVLLLNLPLSYILLKIGYSAYTVFVVGLFLSIMALFARLYVLKRQVGISIYRYCISVILPCVVTAVISFGMAAIFKYNTIDNVPMLIVRSLLSISITIILFLFIGFSKHDREEVLSSIRKKLNHK